MSKKYLIDDFEELKGSYIFDKQDAKEVEVLDWDEVEVKFRQSKFLTFRQFASSNNLQIIKIVE